MRTIKELLELMLQHKNLFNEGLCSWSHYLYYRDLIDVEERHILLEFIEDHRNTPILSIQDFWYGNLSNSSYFWEYGKLTPRIHWINYQIKQLKLINYENNKRITRVNVR